MQLRFEGTDLAFDTARQGIFMTTSKKSVSEVYCLFRGRGVP